MFVLNICKTLNINKKYLNYRYFNNRSFSSYYTKSKSIAFNLGNTLSRLSSICLLSTISIYQKVDDQIPKPTVIRHVKSISDSTGLTLTLYQYQSCPFCCKIRAYLDYRGFSYNIVEVNSLRRKEIKWSSYKKVPIVTCSSRTDKEIIQLNDSSLIISALESFLINKNIKMSEIAEYYPSIETEDSKGKKGLEYPNKYYIMYNEGQMPKESDAVRKWRKWTDDDLVHTISPNIYRSVSEAIETFKFFSEVGEWRKNFGDFEAKLLIYSASITMYFIGKLLKRRHGLTDDVRISMYNSVRVFITQLKNQKSEFMGGQKPNLADLAVFGVLNSIEGTQAFRDIEANVNGLTEWYSAVKSLISKNAGDVIKTENNLVSLV